MRRKTVEIFSYRLKLLRNQQQKTQQEVATYLGIARGSYAQYEIGRRLPDLYTLYKLANFFNVSSDFLLGREHVLREDQEEYQSSYEKKEKWVQETCLQFAERLRTIREAKGWTHVMTSKETGVAVERIKKLEKAAIMPDINDIVKIAKGCHVTSDYLLGLTNLSLDVLKELTPIIQKISNELKK
jgi:transcriptional regulator with XRE-family HTH domain